MLLKGLERRNTSIHCPTKELAEQVFNLCQENGRYGGWSKEKFENYRQNYNEDFVIYPENTTIDDIEYTKKGDTPVLKAEYFLKLNDHPDYVNFDDKVSSFKRGDLITQREYPFQLVLLVIENQKGSEIQAVTVVVGKDYNELVTYFAERTTHEADQFELISDMKLTLTLIK